MKSLFEADAANDTTSRLDQLRPDSERLWGKMSGAQMLAHCSAAIEMAEGKVTPRRNFLGRLLGPLAKRSVILNGKPMLRNAMTEKSLLVADERNFLVERQRLQESIGRFASGGPAMCTKHPHFFFGPLTPMEWAVLMHQHLDHHLRQFSA